MRRYLPDLRSNRIESHHQEMVLFSREFCRFLPAPWPGEAPGFKALIEEKKAVAFARGPDDISFFATDCTVYREHILLPRLLRVFQ